MSLRELDGPATTSPAPLTRREAREREEAARSAQAKAIYRIGEHYPSADETLSKLGWAPNRQPGTRGATLRLAA